MRKRKRTRWRRGEGILLPEMTAAGAVMR